MFPSAVKICVVSNPKILNAFHIKLFKAVKKESPIEQFLIDRCLKYYE